MAVMGSHLAALILLRAQDRVSVLVNMKITGFFSPRRALFTELHELPR